MRINQKNKTHLNVMAETYNVINTNKSTDNFITIKNELQNKKKK